MQAQPIPTRTVAEVLADGKRPSVLNIDCPKCGAGLGEHCKSDALIRTHMARIDALRHEKQRLLSTVVQVYGNAGGKHEWPAAMGIDWMTYDEIAEAVPPAYTKHIGFQLRDALMLRAGELVAA